MNFGSPIYQSICELGFFWCIVILKLLLSTTKASELSLQPTGGFPIARLYVSIPEELPLGSGILDLANQPQIKNLLSEFDGSNSAYQYRLMNTFDSHLFRINSGTGQLSTASRLDREALCLSQKAQFCCNARSSIPESVMPHDEWSRVDPRSKAQQCHLVAHISFQPQTEISHPSNDLDSPAIHFQGQNNRLAMIYVYIRLNDINDHTPQFISPSSSINIPEDTPVGSVLHYLRILDPDAFPNGLKDVQLTVTPLNNMNGPQATAQHSAHFSSVTESSPSLIGNPFETRLSRDGVSLILVNALDREKIPAYDVAFVASDGDPTKPKSSHLNMRIYVTDVNDNPPIWVEQKDNKDNSGQLTSPSKLSGPLQTETTTFNVSVPEDTQVGALIFWLQARDADLGDNARLQYAIDTAAPGGMSALDFFTVQSTTGEVRLRTQLDYDSASMQMNGPELEVPLIVRDNPRTGRQLNARAILHVQILDVNDINPIIVASPLLPSGPSIRRPFLHSGEVSPLFSIWENQPPGQPVASILVSDPDTGDSGKISCALKNEYFVLKSEYGQMPFHSTYDSTGADVGTVGPLNYQLISTQKLDREQMARHQVLITCRDHDTVRPLVSSKHLDIEVLDENDNVPEFTSKLVEFSCPENAPPGQIIGYLNATDKDGPDNAQLRYWVDEHSLSWINVHCQTGEVRVNTLFDRELETQRQFTVYVSDGVGSNAHTASTTVKVNILDENDHTPQFTDLYFFSIAENSPPGTEVGRVSAKDEDSEENGRIHYLLRQPSKEFELNRTTGVIKVRAARNDLRTAHMDHSPTYLDREKQDTYELNVIAEDGGLPARRSTTVVHISLSDINDHAPVFRYPAPHGIGSVLNVSCAQLSSQIIARVYANDSDSGQNGEIEYSIVRNSNRPKRSQLEGKQNKTDSKVQTAHNKTDSKSSTVARDTKSVTDMDLLLGGPTENHFEINSYNGQLFLIHPIMECNQPTNVRLLIKAQDSGNPPKSSTALLTIHVQPTDDDDRNSGGLTGRGMIDAHTSITDPRSRGLWNGLPAVRKSAGSVHEQPGNLTLFGSSHWSAIVGLVVAMIVLVLLLCVMLVVLRRRFVVEEQKSTSQKVLRMNQHMDGSNADHTMRKSNEDDSSPLYFKGTHIARSLHELNPNSPHGASLSPTVLTQTDDVHCSQMTLDPNTHYFCTLPPPNTVSFNSGEVAILRPDEHRIGVSRTLDLSNRKISPKRFPYAFGNSTGYGYVDHDTRIDMERLGCPHQALWSATAAAAAAVNVTKRSTEAEQQEDEEGKNQELFRRNIWKSDKPYSCCANNSKNLYTPLLDTDCETFRLNNNQARNRQHKEDQKKNGITEASDEKIVFYTCDRTLGTEQGRQSSVELLPNGSTLPVQPIKMKDLSHRAKERNGKRAKRDRHPSGTSLTGTDSKADSNTTFSAASFV